MNSVEKVGIPDIQSSADDRQLAIDKVGIKGLRHPLKIAEMGGSAQSTVAVLDMFVALPKHLKGTHMSRFVEILNRRVGIVSADSFKDMVHEMLVVLEAKTGSIEMSFPFFMEKEAPISKVLSLMDYQVCFLGSVVEGDYTFSVKVVVPVKSLCPCSKEISDYGAHNQRSHVTITAELSLSLIHI